jgi:hypothetical protein
MPNPPDVGTISIVISLLHCSHSPVNVICDLSGLLENIALRILIVVNTLDLWSSVSVIERLYGLNGQTVKWLNRQSIQKKCRKLKCRLGKPAFLLNVKFYPLYLKCQSRIIKYNIGKKNTCCSSGLKVTH